MFARSCAITVAAATASPFLSGKRLSFSGANVSPIGKMSFAGAGNTSQSWINIEAFAESTSNTKSDRSRRRRLEEFKPPTPLNLYDVLRVKETASQVEIKTAYRSLAKHYHPDAATSDSDAQNFMEIHNAYSVLSDPTARARYDASIAARRRFRSSSGFAVGRTTRWETDQCW